MKPNALLLTDQDNVATAINSISVGGDIVFSSGNQLVKIQVKNAIAYGHKVAVSPIKTGDKIIKYSAVIGEATQEIMPGEHVHVHNVVSLRGRGDLKS